MIKLSGGSLFVCCTQYNHAHTCELKVDLKSALGAIPSQLDNTHTHEILCVNTQSHTYSEDITSTFFILEIRLIRSCS
jgi:hypothetical protein